MGSFEEKYTDLVKGNFEKKSREKKRTHPFISRWRSVGWVVGFRVGFRVGFLVCPKAVGSWVVVGLIVL